MCRSRVFLLIVIIVAFSVGTFAQTPTPVAAVKSFYAYDWTHSTTFNRKNLDSRKKWLSAGFYKLFREELRKEKAYLKIHPTDKPFFGDGFSFSPLNENCAAAGAKPISRKYLVRNSILVGHSVAKVPVRFYYPKPCTPEPVTYVVKLIRTRGGWVIDDVIYEDGTSSLSQDMKQNHY